MAGGALPRPRPPSSAIVLPLSLTQMGNDSGCPTAALSVAAKPRGGPVNSGPVSWSFRTGGVLPIATSLNGSTW